MKEEFNVHSARNLVRELDSFTSAFPSQGAVLEETYSKKAQIESLKLLANQYQSLLTVTGALKSLLQRAEQQQIAAQERDRVEAQRYKENTRLSRVAAWAAVISVILAVIAILK